MTWPGAKARKREDEAGKAEKGKATAGQENEIGRDRSEQMTDWREKKEEDRVGSRHDQGMTKLVFRLDWDTIQAWIVHPNPTAVRTKPTWNQRPNNEGQAQTRTGNDKSRKTKPDRG